MPFTLIAETGALDERQTEELNDLTKLPQSLEARQYFEGITAPLNSNNYIA